MKNVYPTCIKLFIAFALIFNLNTALGQSTKDSILTKQIVEQESATRRSFNLIETQRKLQALKVQALKIHNDVLYARCLSNLLRLTDKVSQDTMYFRNSAFLDTLLNQRQSPKLKALLHIMHAQRIGMFNVNYSRFRISAYQTKDLKYNYAALTQQGRDSIVANDLQQALKYPGSHEDANDLLWLSSGPDMFLFRPRFSDIVLTERINMALLRQQSTGVDNVQFNNWLSLSSGALIAKLDSLSKTGNTNPMSFFGPWLALHKSDKGVYAFIESIARKHIYTNIASDTTNRNIYISYLKSCIQSTYPALKAHAIYQLCLILNEEGNNYANSYQGRMFASTKPRPENQFKLVEALNLYNKHKALMAGYAVFNKVLDQMVLQIKQQSLMIQLADKHLPGSPIKMRAMYKNTDTLFYRIVRVSATEALDKGRLFAVAQLLKKETVTQDFFALPLPADFNDHATYLKLNGLASGHYQILFSGRPILDGNTTIYHLPFEVTPITAINSDTKLFVLDRKTGLPLMGAHVMPFIKGIVPTTNTSYVVNKQGFIDLKDEKIDSVSIYYKNDTTGFFIGINVPGSSNSLYDGEDDEDLTDFYADNLRREIFTDRSIYRPGQTVHYKVILMTKNTANNAAMIANEQNIGKKIFKRLRKQLADDKDDKIWIEDPFDRKTDSISVNINEFGSQSGSFVIPANAATGDWRINGIDGYRSYNSSNSGDFKVEEYKRPTIELAADKPKQMLLPGKPFSLKLKLKSLNGASLGNIPIKYNIRCTGALPQLQGRGNTISSYYYSREILAKTAYTDNKGEIAIEVKDTLLAGLTLPDTVAWHYNYSIDATATDATGEQTTFNTQIAISSRPIAINIPAQPVYDRHLFAAIPVITTAEHEGVVERNVRIKVYKIENPDTSPAEPRYFIDQWYYNKAEWYAWFPDDEYIVAKPQKPVIMVDTMVHTDINGKLMLDKARFAPGFYKVMAGTKDGDKTLGQMERNFHVFDSNTGETATPELDYMPLQNDARPGDTLTWYTAGNTPNYTIYQVTYATTKNKIIIKNVYQAKNEKPGLRIWKFKIPHDIDGNFKVNLISVKNNEIINRSKNVNIVIPIKATPEIIIEKYRKVMSPGSQQTFSVSVKTKDANTLAELMTTMYDASLDKLNRHHWNIPNTEAEPTYISTNWTSDLTSVRYAGQQNSFKPIHINSLLTSSPATNQTGEMLAGRGVGMSVVNAKGLNEVVIVGYGSTLRRNLTGAVTRVILRGNRSLQDYNQPLVVVDGVIHPGGIAGIEPGRIVNIMVLKGADGSALYGSMGAKGVLVISTKGPIVLPNEPEPVAKVRKNFNETAFFFPKVYAGTDGYYTINFTMPETATEWTWKMLAHTRKSQFAYLERKLQTQLSLMVQPNMPRILYQGDKINLQSRITNLDSIAITGKITCKIEDAVTGEDLTKAIAATSLKSFSLSAKSSGAAAFDLDVPTGMLNPLKIVVTATGPGMADAEEHIIPVRAKKVFVKQSQRLTFMGQSSLAVKPIKLPANADVYGISLSINQKPQASLINALPWLANYSYDCAEQNFNKLRARATALLLMRKDTLAQQAFARAKPADYLDTAKTNALPNDIAEDAMPWLNSTNNTLKQQKQLYKLLDTVANKQSINKHLEKLYSLQQPDGGLAWFEGGKSNAYISSYVLAGFGQIKQSGWLPNDVQKQQTFINKLVAYTQTGLQLNKGKSNELYDLYAASYFKSVSQNEAVASALQNYWQRAEKLSLQNQALLIINTLRYTEGNTTLHNKAIALLESIKQMAINDNVNGMRWKEYADSDELNDSEEETMALLAEAFNTSGKYPAVQNGILKWLLSARQDEHWQTTKATAAAIDLLQKDKGSVLGASKSFSANVNGSNLAVSDDLLNGKPSAFSVLNKMPAQISLQQNNTNATGNITWHYFTNADKLDTLNKAVKLKKQFYSFDSKKGWLLLKDTTTIKPGDRIQIKLTIEAATRLKFVHINDPRAAAFEPKDINSGYRYSDDLSYYQSIRDTGMDMFAEEIPRGTSEITYELVVSHSGQFNSGPAKLECMYAPAVSGYSNSTKVTVK